jgi:hypothetical protein
MQMEEWEMMDHVRYHQRTVQWGHWGITFMDIQPDTAKNFGKIVGTVHFAVGTRGPIDAGDVRQTYRDMCEAWISSGVEPVTMEKYNV